MVLVNVLSVMMVYMISYREMLSSKQTGHIIFCDLQTKCLTKAI